MRIASAVRAMPWPRTRANLDHAVVGKAGVVELLDHLGGLDVVVVVALLAVVVRAEPERDAMAAQQHELTEFARVGEDGRVRYPAEGGKQLGLA